MDGTGVVQDLFNFLFFLWDLPKRPDYSMIDGSAADPFLWAGIETIVASHVERQDLERSLPQGLGVHGATIDAGLGVVVAL